MIVICEAEPNAGHCVTIVKEDRTHYGVSIQIES